MIFSFVCEWTSSRNVHTTNTTSSSIEFITIIFVTGTITLALTKHADSFDFDINYVETQPRLLNSRSTTTFGNDTAITKCQKIKIKIVVVGEL